jgi:hypothetical protein
MDAREHDSMIIALNIINDHPQTFFSRRSEYPRMPY